MKDWFDTLEPREKLLMSLAALLTVACLAWFAAVAPSLQAHSAAQAREVASARALDFVASSLSRLSADRSDNPSPEAPALSGDERRRQITVAAQETGLLLTQLRSEADGTVSVVLRDVDPRLVFAFVQLLSTRDGIEPRTATLSRSEGALVSATLVFEGHSQ